MFENSLIASGVSLDQRRNAKRTRWIALTSVGIQGLVLAGFLVVPLLWPETLPLVSVTPKLTSLTLKKPEVKIQPRPIPVVTTTDSFVHAPSQAQPSVESRGSGIIHQDPSITETAEEPAFTLRTGMGNSSILGPSGVSMRSSPAVVAATPKSATPVRISDGVSKGLLLAPIQPVYPRIAVMSHVEGTVVVTATIDKQGRIIGLQVVSGPEMLKTAAVDAIKDARYTPYLLNGEPTDIITTISVNFHLGT